MLARLLARPWIVLVVALIAHTAAFVAVQQDLQASDPMWYAGWAYRLAHHPADMFRMHNTYPFVMRLGVIGPVALGYRLLGVSTLATNLPCLLAGLAILGIVWAAPSTPRGKILAVVFALVSTPLVYDGRELNPDLPCAAAMAASVLCLSRRDRPRGAWWVLGAVLAWFAAFQIKEVAVWLVPVWAYAAIGDLRAHGVRWVARTYAAAVGVAAALAAGYLALCAALWDDPLARIHGIDDAAPTHEWSLVGKPAAAWIARLTWQPAVLLYRMYRSALALVAIAPWLAARRDRIWIVATLSIVALYWFGSSTGALYLPLPIWRRMVLPALPGIVVVSAIATGALLDRLRGARARLALAAVLALSLAAPHVRALGRALAAAGQPERAAFAVLRAELAAGDRVVLVCGDPRCPASAAFHLGFEPPPNLRVVPAAEFAAAALPDRARVRALVHLTRGDGSGRGFARRVDALGLPAIVGDRVLRLYDAGDGARLHDALARPVSDGAKPGEN